LRSRGVTIAHDAFFDTVFATVPGKAAEVVAAARELGINLRRVDASQVGIACAETTTRTDLARVWRAFDQVMGSEISGARSGAKMSPHLLSPEEPAKQTKI